MWRLYIGEPVKSKCGINSLRLGIFYASPPSVFARPPCTVSSAGNVIPPSPPLLFRINAFSTGYTPLSTEGLPESVSRLTAQRPHLFFLLKNSWPFTPFRSFYKTIRHSGVLGASLPLLILFFFSGRRSHWIVIRRHHATLVPFPPGRSRTGRCCR